MDWKEEAASDEPGSLMKSRKRCWEMPLLVRTPGLLGNGAGRREVTEDSVGEVLGVGLSTVLRHFIEVGAPVPVLFFREKNLTYFNLLSEPFPALINTQNRQNRPQ